MRLPLRSIPDHARPFPLRSRTGQLHKLGPKYMAKRPLLTIQIPSGVDRLERSDRVHEVSCFSPFTPDDDESYETESISSPAGHKGEEHEIAAQESHAQSTSDRSQDEMDENQISMVRIGSRWSLRYQRNSLQSMITQAYLTPTRRKRVSTTSVLPLSLVGSESTRCSPSQRIGHPDRRRRSNPFDCFGACRSSKMYSPRILETTTSPYPLFAAVSSPGPLGISDHLSTPKPLGASSLRSDTC